MRGAGLLQGPAQPGRRRHSSSATTTGASGGSTAASCWSASSCGATCSAGSPTPLSRSERKDTPDAPWHLFRYDQTHILTLIASYKLPWGASRSGCASATSPATRRRRPIGGLRDTSTQDYDGGASATANATRLPDFHQLDLRIDKTFTFNRWKLGVYLDVQNVYNRANTETLVYGGRQLYQQGRVVGLPIFPDLGLRAAF